MTLSPKPEALGKPIKPSLVSRLHVLAVFISLSCLAAGIVITTPALNIAWRLGFQLQIVLVGLLLGIMNICASIVLPSVFLLVEARFGRSRLQNYQAILTGKWTGSKVTWGWRIILISFIALPLALSVAYKQFLGGTAESSLTPSSPRSYALDFPRIGSWTPTILNSIYLLLTAFTPFWAAAEQGKAAYPVASEFPLAYGYNTLLLDDDAAAVLDVPTPAYIAALQSKLSTGEVLNISADVDAYVARRDTLTASLPTNDTLWSQFMAESVAQNLGGLSTIELYQGKGARLAVLPGGNNDQMLIGLYYDSDYYGDMHFHTNATDPEALRFRQRAQLYSVRRARCHGAWRLNATGIFLDGGFCNSTVVVDQGVLHKKYMGPFSYDILPPLLHTFNRLVINNKTESPWLRPTYALSVATIYWSRGLYMSQSGDDHFSPYAPIGEAVTSTRSTLRAGTLLYLVFAIHPALTVLGFAVICWLRKVPVGPGFSFVSIMAGMEPENLALLRGAGFSGELRSPVRLGITAEDLKEKPTLSDASSRDEETGSTNVASTNEEASPDGVGSVSASCIRYNLTKESEAVVRGHQFLRRDREYK
ncbi:hypothetical protein NEMBOFW57_004713 [Staphylotrichum longicolle]|uniref:Uncharacterized protein n=1 Tax=Staphylotrichum longicolle TaxID=669026 RepID=A0AAD4F7Y0_9PEZI|nr:hypothetical protein NEMBOFW57_004713 [Staphylotrichum longicolle]